MNYTLILGSSSPFRKALLEKLQLPFDIYCPDIDETAKQDESANQLVERLAIEKAKAAALAYSQQQNINERLVVIGSDQVALINGQIVGKPLTHENAVAQLLRSSGQAITFYTGLAVYDNQTEQTYSCVEPFTVHFRTLTLQQIEYYVQAEQPLYCAGSFKCEGLGIALFEKMEGDDPNSLVGLPLIKLIDLLAKHNVQVLS
ncbi:Maf family protein [Shewanella maritima]|uniref:Maf family protein n=1 Tax=Shewanella maritima TaxID=2520507 RepID=UPI003735E644